MERDVRGGPAGRWGATRPAVRPVRRAGVALGIVLAVLTTGHVDLAGAEARTSRETPSTALAPTTPARASRALPVGIVPVVPARVADTRVGGATVDGSMAGVGAVAHGGVLTVPVAGRGGVPGTDVDAVMINVTAVSPAEAGFVTVYPCGARRPDASNLNFTAGQVVPNLVLAKVGTGGSICVYSSAPTDLLVDVTGWIPDGSEVASLVPARVADTRVGGATVDGSIAGVGAIAGGEVLSVPVVDRGGVPRSGVDAVVVNVTAVSPAAAGFVTVYPCGARRPDASNLNFTAGQVVPNLALAKVGTGGSICVYSSAPTDLLVDVTGWTAAGPAITSLVPARLADTRQGPPGEVDWWGNPIDRRVAAGTAQPVRVVGEGGVPSTGAAAVMLNVTVVDPVGSGYVTVYSCDEERPNASNLNYEPGQTVANSVLAELGPMGLVCLYTHADAHLIVDVTAWASPPPPYGASAALALPRAGLELGTALYEDWYGSTAPWGTAEQALLFRTADGSLGVAIVDLAESAIVVRRHDPTTLAPIGAPTTLSFDGWDRFGGLHAAANGELFVLVGRDNRAERPGIDVIEVRRYDPSLRLVGTARLRGTASQVFEGIAGPFDASAADMVVIGDRLVVHIGRTMFRGDDGLNHQSNLTFEVDLTTMTATTFDRYDMWTATPYVSHSFLQRVARSGSTLVFADHGDAYPRSMVISVIDGYPTRREVRRIDAFHLNGEIGDNFTGATLTGLHVDDGRALIVGNSIRQPNAPRGPLGDHEEHRNIYVASVDLGTSRASHQWLTRFPPSGGPSAGQPRMVPLDGNRLALLFPVTENGLERTEYRLLRRDGTVVASRTFPGLPFEPAAEPLLVGTDLMWIGRDHSERWNGQAFIYALDVTDPTSPRLIGHSATPSGR